MLRYASLSPTYVPTHGGLSNSWPYGMQTNRNTHMSFLWPIQAMCAQWTSVGACFFDKIFVCFLVVSLKNTRPESRNPAKPGLEQAAHCMCVCVCFFPHLWELRLGQAWLAHLWGLAHGNIALCQRALGEWLRHQILARLASRHRGLPAAVVSHAPATLAPASPTGFPLWSPAAWVREHQKGCMGLSPPLLRRLSTHPQAFQSPIPHLNITFVVLFIYLLC